ncbi:hypothetical protein M1P56_22045 [Streptomyces sp. HU2014]|uniref:Uncharacterized protein n=1 Tax=Streptomyces albireticuli TaxID=1940 RepID=A0A1Z2KX35_9ACTN|nr:MULTISPECIES: hypothetical protein [Streptomyces]ARZ66600.1 hypothetical protein SMD11_0934 [Streptomyces albireticuli]UQI46838.1 hypothetical protein M1P56_22045 [Streptomyces sp. HU2014]
MPRSNDIDGDVVEAVLTTDARLIAGEFENRRRGGRPAGPGPRSGTGGGPTARDEASQELDLACVLVISAAEAATSLERLEDGRGIDPEGALVFACLLHVVGHTGAADFWWRFGAGGGSRTAAYCLHLSHRRNGEFRDAAFWRAEASHVPEEEREPRPARPAAGGRRLLPDAARHALLVQWHSGLTPHLPAALESVVNRLAVAGDDEDFGEVPQPDPGLVARLARER